MAAMFCARDFGAAGKFVRLVALSLLSTGCVDGNLAARGQVLELGNQRELFVNRYLIERLEGTELRLGEPQPQEVAITIDRPWEGWYNMGTTVFFHGGKYLMYYRCISGTTFGPQLVCYAESADAIHWTKPNLGLVKVAGTRDNNVVALEDGQPVERLDVFLDTRPGVPDTERIKGLYYVPLNKDSGTEVRTVFLASPDGLQFHRLKPQPSFTTSITNAFDSPHNAYFWSEAEQQYVGYFRHSDPLRSVARVTSRNLLQWTEPVPMTYGGAPREHIYMNNTSPYFRAPHIYVAPAVRFMEGRGTHPSEGVLMTTRAGSKRYDRTFMEAFMQPGPGKSNWVARSNFPMWGIVETGPAEISFFVNRDYSQPTWHLRRYTLRTDGFASVHAPYSGGELITKLFRFDGRELELNVATSAAGGVRVEIQDQFGRPIDGYTLADASEFFGDDIAHVVAWESGTDVSSLAGRPIRLRFVMRDADLYSLRFR